MTPIVRLLLVLALAAHAAGSARPAAAAPTKSVKDCNKELEQQRDALDKAGDTPQAFFHRCWWESKPGEATPLESAKGRPGPLAKREPSSEPAAAPKPKAERRLRTQVARPRAEPRYAPPGDTPPWPPGPRRIIPPPPYGPPPGPMLDEPPPPVLLARRPPPPFGGPRICANLGPITAGLIRGRPCVPLPIGPVVDVP